MSTRNTLLLALGLWCIVIASSAIAYPYLPDPVASHWNASGEVNGYMPKIADLMLLPGMMAAVFALLLGLPLIDPLGKNITAFRPQYNLVILGLGLMLALVHGITLAWNLGWRFSMGTWLAILIAIFFYVIGALLPASRRNWTFGIRTPWTLSSDVVWEKTHRFGSWLFRGSAVVILLGALLPDLVIAILTIDLIIVVTWVFVYSYLEYRKVESK